MSINTPPHGDQLQLGKHHYIFFWFQLASPLLHMGWWPPGTGAHIVQCCTPTPRYTPGTCLSPPDAPHLMGSYQSLWHLAAALGEAVTVWISFDLNPGMS